MNKTNKKFKDPGSAITHLIAMIGAVICAFPLIGKAVHTNNSIVVFAMSVFISSMILLYGASTLYHSLDISKKVNLFFRRIDHSMIFVLIAGSYTPVCLLALDRKQGIPLLVLVWATAIIGIIIKIFFINCPHWVSSIIYIGMGWTCVLVFKPLLANLPASAFAWLLAGGIIYTVGGINALPEIFKNNICTLKRASLDDTNRQYMWDSCLKVIHFDKLPKDFGSHEIFHLFVMGGSICHFIFMYAYLM